MSSKLLSVVVPTKNRSEYLKALIEIVMNFGREDVELVIEDNSEDNTEILKFLQEKKYKNIVYNHEASPLSVVENSDRAILHSSGKYVTFIGDDDCISKYVCEFVELMDKCGCDSAIFNVAKYYWPGVEFKMHNFPNLIINNFKNKIVDVNVEQELLRVLNRGATSLELLPKVYHGIVLRKRLDEIFDITGTYFPGPSPDMANAVALATVVKKHIYCDTPFITAGASVKSAAGLGTKHKHEGNLKDMSFLPKDTEENWNADILKIWTGPTIYAQSALYALGRLNKEDLKTYFNYNYHYAFLSIFCPSYLPLFKEFAKETDKFKLSKYSFYKITIFGMRVKTYLNNLMLLKLKIGGDLKDGIVNTVQAEKYIDGLLGDVKFKNI